MKFGFNYKDRGKLILDIYISRVTFSLNYLTKNIYGNIFLKNTLSFKNNFQLIIYISNFEINIK